MKLKLDTLSDTYEEYKSAVKTLQEVKEDLFIITGTLDTCWEGAGKEICLAKIRDYVNVFYENTLISMEAIKDILKKNIQKANTCLNRCDAFADVVNLNGPNFYTDDRKGGGTLSFDEDTMNSLMNQVLSIGGEETQEERRKWQQVMNKISLGYCSSLRYSQFSLNVESFVLEKALQDQEDSMMDFYQTLNTYVQEVQELDGDAATDFKGYTDKTQKKLTARVYKPIVVNDKINMERLYYLLHTPPSALSEAELNEIITAYETAVKNGDAKQVEEILKCCYEYDEQKGQNNYKLTETYYVVEGIMKAKLDLKAAQSGMNLMDPHNEYNDATIDFIEEIKRYSLFSGLGEYAPNIKGTGDLFDRNFDPSHRIILHVDLETYGASFWKSEKDYEEAKKKGKYKDKSLVSYETLEWSENQQLRLNNAVIKKLQSEKRSFEDEVKNYFINKLIDGTVGAKINEKIDEILKKSPAGVRIAYEAATMVVDISKLYNEIEAHNNGLSLKQEELKIGFALEALGIRSSMIVSNSGEVTITKADIDPVETRARIAWAKEVYNKENKNTKVKFDFTMYLNIYNYGLNKKKKGWNDLTDREKELWREKYKGCKDIVSFNELFGEE